MDAISKDKINQWSSLEQLSHNGTHGVLSFKSKTAIRNQCFFASMPVASCQSDCLTRDPGGYDEITFMIQTWCEWKICQRCIFKEKTYLGKYPSSSRESEQNFNTTLVSLR